MGRDFAEVARYGARDDVSLSAYLCVAPTDAGCHVATAGAAVDEPTLRGIIHRSFDAKHPGGPSGAGE